MKLDYIAYRAQADDPKLATRRMVEQLAVLAEYLSPAQQVIAKAVLVEGRTLADISRSLEMDWDVVKRFYAKLVRRKKSRPFLLAVRNMDRLEPAEQKFARQAILAGHSFRWLSNRLGISVHMVRKQLAGLLAKLARLEGEREEEWVAEDEALAK
jgi:hypothetical protein